MAAISQLGQCIENSNFTVTETAAQVIFGNFFNLTGNLSQFIVNENETDMLTSLHLHKTIKDSLDSSTLPHPTSNTLKYVINNFRVRYKYKFKQSLPPSVSPSPRKFQSTISTRRQYAPKGFNWTDGAGQNRTANDYSWGDLDDFTGLDTRPLYGKRPGVVNDVDYNFRRATIVEFAGDEDPTFYNGENNNISNYTDIPSYNPSTNFNTYFSEGGALWQFSEVDTSNDLVIPIDENTEFTNNFADNDGWTTLNLSTSIVVDGTSTSTPVTLTELQDAIVNSNTLPKWQYLSLYYRYYPDNTLGSDFQYTLENYEIEFLYDYQINSQNPQTVIHNMLKSSQSRGKFQTSNAIILNNPTVSMSMKLKKKTFDGTSDTELLSTSLLDGIELKEGRNYLPIKFSNTTIKNNEPLLKGDMCYFEYAFSNYDDVGNFNINTLITPVSTTDITETGHHVEIEQEVGGVAGIQETQIELFQNNTPILSEIVEYTSLPTSGTDITSSFTPLDSFKYEAGDIFKIKFSARKGLGTSFTLDNPEFKIFPYYTTVQDLNSHPLLEGGVHLPTYFGAGNLPFNFAHDCQPTYNNYVDSRSNSKLMEVDYSLNRNSQGSLFPSNMSLILENTATKAQIPDSNYTTISHTSLRYEGTKTSNQYLNEWSPKDLGTYGKLPAVELRDAHFGYFNDLSDPYPLLNGKTRVNLNFLIDGDGNAIPPSLDDIIAKSILESTFPKDGTARLSVSSGNVELQGLNDLKPIYSMGKMPVPIVYTQNSINGHADMIEFEGEGRISMYDDPTDKQYVKDYSFNATGEGYSNPSFPNNRNIEIILSPPEIKYKEYDGSTDNATNTPYDVNTGVFKFNDESSTNGTGSDTSQDHYMDLETSITSTYLYDGDYNKNGSFWRKHKHEERLEMSLKLGLEYSLDDFVNHTNIPYNFEDLKLKIHFLDGSYKEVGSVSNKVKFIQSQSSRKSPQGDKNSPLYKYKKGNGIPLNKQNQIEIQIDNDIIKDIVKENGLGNEVGIQTDGKITGLEWIFKANSGENRYKKNSSLRWKIQGDMISDIKNASNNTFYPANYAGPTFPTNLTLQGAKSNIFANDNKTGTKFWRFAHEIPSSSTPSGTSPLNILYMEDSNFNEAYGTAFKQKALVYTPGDSDHFPGGHEPAGASIGDPYSNIEFKVGDEIRFNNNENHSYVILKITSPANSTETGDLKSLLKIELDRDLPDTNAFNKDFFLIRRYIPNINSVYLDSPFPYGTLAEAQTTPGILYPDYPTDYLKDNASNIITELTDKGIIK